MRLKVLKPEGDSSLRERHAFLALNRKVALLRPTGLVDRERFGVGAVKVGLKKKFHPEK